MEGLFSSTILDKMFGESIERQEYAGKFGIPQNHDPDQLILDFSSPPEPEWFQPELFSEEDYPKDDSEVLFYSTGGAISLSRATESPNVIAGDLDIGGELTVQANDPKAWLYLTDNYKIGQPKKPNAFVRLMHKVFFGFKWETA